MKIVLCGSIDFAYEMKEVADSLVELGHEAEIPLTAQKILKQELTLGEFKAEKENGGDAAFRRKVECDVIRRYYDIIKNSDAILVLNYNKNDIQNYVGGNTFLEMGFAHVLEKPIYLMNEIPKMSYSDEIRAMRPVVIEENLSKIKKQ